MTVQVNDVTAVDTGNGAAINHEFQVSPAKVPFVVPEGFKEKEWVKNVEKSADPHTELFNQVENAQKLIGQRSGIQVPGPDATPEQKKAFHAALGVPESSESYVYIPPTAEGEDKPIYEFLNSTRSEKAITELKKAAHKHGLRPEQFQGFSDDADKVFVAEHKAKIVEMQAKNAEIAAENERLKAEFEGLSDKAFGQRKPQVIENTKKMLPQYLPPELVPLIDKMNIEGLVVLAGFAESVRVKHLKEDSFTQVGASTAAPMSEAEYRNKGQQLTEVVYNLQKKGVTGPALNKAMADRQAHYDSRKPT